MNRVLVMNRQDTVGTALSDIKRGDQVSVVLLSQEVIAEIAAKQAIPSGHKMAISPAKEGEPVMKYGEVIGQASRTIEPGEHVHVHNLKSNRMQMPEMWYR